MPVQHRDGRALRALHRMGQGGEVGLLALVQVQAAERSRPAFRACAIRPGSLAAGEHPGFAEMRHDEIRRGLARRVEQADGVAMQKDEGADSFVVGVDSLGGRTRQRMALNVLDHDWILR